MRLAADAAHQFGGIELDRSKPLRFKLNGQTIEGFAGDTVLSAALAAGITAYGTLGETPIGLSEGFAPLVTTRRGEPLPMDRVPALDGLELTSVGKRKNLRGPPNSLRHQLETIAEPDWAHRRTETTMVADLLIVGGGVAGLAAAKSASMAGRGTIVAERRPWFGGDARYFGPVGDEESPEALIKRLTSGLAVTSNVTLLLRAEVVALSGHTATILQVVIDEGVLRSRLLSVHASRILLATGATQRLPVFPGNRLPGVQTSISAYHFAKRYGVSLGPSAAVATQSNYGYRLAMRLNDAGVAIRRVADPRIHPQSRFIDYAKASGLTLASGQYPLSARPGHFAFANAGSLAVAAEIEAAQLIVSGGWQPDLPLWMMAGGNVRWSSERAALVAAGALDDIAIAGAAAGHRSMLACADSARAAQAQLFGEEREGFEDTEAGTELETPDAPTSSAPAAEPNPSFLSSGTSLATRAPSTAIHALSLGDVAAAVELGIITPGDAGAVAEERGAPGADLAASDWKPPAEAPADGVPAYLAQRFGDAPERVHLMVDHRRRFAIGALIYAAGMRPDPMRAIGVIVEAAPVGGMALIARAALNDRYVVETEAGPSPARPRPAGPS